MSACLPNVRPWNAAVGTVEGVIVWKVDRTNELTILSEEEHGSFYDSSCYIILRTYGHPANAWDIHFWLGTRSSAHWQAVTIFNASSLDKHLGGKARQFREVQDHESAQFLALFKSKIRYLRGEEPHSLLKTTEEPGPRLYQVKGKRNCRVTEVPFAVTSLNQGDVFILEATNNIFVWNGPSSNQAEKIKAAETARSMRDIDRKGRAQIEFIDDEWDCHEEFFRLLGAKPSPPISRPVVDDVEYERCPPQGVRLFRVCDATGEVVVSEVPPPLSKASLDSEDCFFLHCGVSGVFCWVGAKCTERERREVWNYAKEYLKEEGLPAHTPICRINEGHEPTVFRMALDWPRDLVKPRAEPVVSNADTNIYDLHTANVVRMCSKPMAPPRDDPFAYDDGHGDVKVWRVVKFTLQEVPRREHGIFYSGDSYVIFYKSHRIHNGIVYFWLGNTSTTDEKASAAMFVHQVDQRESKGHALQIRVIQWKEPEHFLRIFGGMLVFLRGGVMSGFRRFRMEARYGLEADSSSGIVSSSTKLYQIRDRRVVEVEPKGSSLNSNDVFVLARPDVAYQWIGVGSNEMECQTVSKFIRRMESIPEPLVAYEAEEPSEFWELLGGFCDYASDEEFRDAGIECTARLFHCSNASGHFRVEEIIAFCQEDLYAEDVMILDAYVKVFVFIGAQSNVVERQRSLQTVQDYVASDPSGRSVDDTEMLVVKQGFEPADFKAHFPGWDDEYWANTLTYEELKEQVLRDISVKQSPLVTVCEAQAAFTMTYPVEVLRQPVDKLPYGVDSVHKEKHLTDDEFAKVFGIEREQYESMVRWKQLELKKRVGLF